MRIGLITCEDLSRFFPSRKNPLYTHDDQVAADALVERGHCVEPVVWGADLTELDAAGFDLLIIRSPWDYMASRETSERFLRWLDRVVRAGFPLENPLPVVRWNLDKHYLAHLADEGVAVVPTRYVSSDEPLDLLAAQQRLVELVIKPCVSAAAQDTFLVRSREDAVSLRDGTTDLASRPLDQVRSGRDFMLQPFLPEVLTAGEWSLVFLGGEYSHAVHKRPRPGHWLVQDELGGSVISDTPPAAVREAAVHAFARTLPAFHKNRAVGAPDVPGPLLYGRVDVILTRAGPRVSELELIEPELFFLARGESSVSPQPAALERFCAEVEVRADA
jgi:glutathione synthase/RimK-type ligase-like ATP-grasp enzyme